ncbi:MAG: hypothetical protein WCG25_05530 [bacterium]
MRVYSTATQLHLIILSVDVDKVNLPKAEFIHSFMSLQLRSKNHPASIPCMDPHPDNLNVATLSVGE